MDAVRQVGCNIVCIKAIIRPPVYEVFQSNFLIPPYKIDITDLPTVKRALYLPLSLLNQLTHCSLSSDPPKLRPDHLFKLFRVKFLGTLTLSAR